MNGIIQENGLSIVISLLTGIISGFMVSQFYREKDKEIYRGQFFNDLKRLTRELIIACGDKQDEKTIDTYMNDIFEFSLYNTLPLSYGVRIKRKEREVLNEFSDLYAEIIMSVCDYVNIKADMSKPDYKMTEDILQRTQFTYKKVRESYIKILSLSPKVFSLGNKKIKSQL